MRILCWIPFSKSASAVRWLAVCPRSSLSLQRKTVSICGLSNPDSFTCLQFDPDLRAVLSLVHGRIIPLFLPLLTPVPLCGFHFLQTKLDCSHFHHQTTAPSLASSLLPEYKRKTAGSPAVKQYSESHGSYRFIVFLFRRLHSVKSFEHQSP